MKYFAHRYLRQVCCKIETGEKRQKDRVNRIGNSRQSAIEQNIESITTWIAI